MFLFPHAATCFRGADELVTAWAVHAMLVWPEHLQMYLVPELWQMRQVEILRQDSSLGNVQLISVGNQYQASARVRMCNRVFSSSTGVDQYIRKAAPFYQNSGWIVTSPVWLYKTGDVQQAMRPCHRVDSLSVYSEQTTRALNKLRTRLEQRMKDPAKLEAYVGLLQRRLESVRANNI